MKRKSFIYHWNESMCVINMIVFVATTSASPASVPFENFFGFLLAGLAIIAGIGYYLLMRKKAI